jgi:endoglucanase
MRKLHLLLLTICFLVLSNLPSLGEGLEVGCSFGEEVGGWVLLRNQVGSFRGEEQVIVIEGTNPGSKLRVKTPEGKLLKAKNVRKAVSPLSGKTRYVVSLGTLSLSGDYQVTIGSETCVIHVSERPFQELSTAALRLFYLVRSGVPITQGGKYNRPVGHADTHVLVHNSAASPLRPAATVISSPYGWYDAGDYNKYVVNSAFSIGLMFAAYDALRDSPSPTTHHPSPTTLHPSPIFQSFNLSIPESGNQTPDFLDEMMFNLRWLLTMQDPYDGGVYHKLTTPNFEGFIMPDECRQQRYVVAKSVTATLDFAAVMADAARLFDQYQTDYPGFSAQAAAMAERAYQWAKDHPNAYYRQRQLKDPPVTTGEYGDGNANDEFFWAASALYRLTGRQQYLDDARQHQPKQFTTPTWGNVASLGAYEWLHPVEGAESKLLATDMMAQLTHYCEETVKDVENSSFQSPYGNSPRDFGWGCLAEKCCCQGMALLYADAVSGTTTYRRYALQNADYLLGRNATGYCFVTGFGDKRPMHPHHRPSAADKIEEPFPGMLVGGPNPGQQDKRELKTVTYPSNVPDESYIDHTDSYASNEIAINWNASLVAFIGWLDALSTHH